MPNSKALITVIVLIAAVAIFGSSITTPPVYSVAGMVLPGAVNKYAFSANLPIGDTDVYTAPAGKRAAVGGCAVWNSSAGTITWFLEIKISAAYYRASINTTTTTLASGNAPISYVLEPGESIAVNTVTTAGLNVGCRVIEFASTLRLYSTKLTAPAVGANTLYTAPSGYNAMVSNATFNPLGANGVVFVCNASGGSRTVNINIVASGGTPTTANQLSPSQTVTNNNCATNFFAGSNLGSGDFLSVNTDANTATQFIYVTVVELPN